MESPYILFGAPRSGTTVTMGVMQRCGLDVGRGCTSPLLENDAINDVFRQYMKQNNIDPRGQNMRTFTPVRNVDPEQLRSQILKAHSPQPEHPWGFKCLLGLFMPEALAAAFPQATYIYCWRPVERVATSMYRTSFFNHYKTECEWWRLAAFYTHRAERLYGFANSKVLFKPFKNKWTSLTEILGLEYCPGLVNAWVRDDKFHK